MEKNQESDNSLIKKKGLIKIMKGAGIGRFGKGSLEAFEIRLKERTCRDIRALARRLEIEGRKTLKKEDISNLASIEREGGRTKDGFEI